MTGHLWITREGWVSVRSGATGCTGTVVAGLAFGRCSPRVPDLDSSLVIIALADDSERRVDLASAILGSVRTSVLRWPKSLKARLD